MHRFFLMVTSNIRDSPEVVSLLKWEMQSQTRGEALPAIPLRVLRTQSSPELPPSCSQAQLLSQLRPDVQQSELLHLHDLGAVAEEQGPPLLVPVDSKEKGLDPSLSKRTVSGLGTASTSHYSGPVWTQTQW